MIEIQNLTPKNKAHFERLLAFCQSILAICRELDIEPILSGSLAVFGYLQNEEIQVHDIDLACSEEYFPNLSRALEARGISHQLKEWHVLQVRQEDLKVEFDSIEYWMGGLPADFDTLVIAACSFKVVSLSTLVALYRRGIKATASLTDEVNRRKHRLLLQKYDALKAIHQAGSLPGSAHEQHQQQ